MPTVGFEPTISASEQVTARPMGPTTGYLINVNWQDYRLHSIVIRWINYSEESAEGCRQDSTEMLEEKHD